MTTTSRRGFLAGGIAAAGVLALGPTFWSRALAAPARLGDGPYGPLRAPDANGIALPSGFTSREVARARQQVTGTAYTWHANPDGQATFREADGGWILVSNSESSPSSGGGSSAIRFDRDGAVRDAYRICGGTNSNCAGGATPWGTWLTCEEATNGQVWECDPLGVVAAVRRPAMGAFKHEAVAVDPANQHLYLTEDETDGCLYRFTPYTYPDLSSGLLELAVVDGDGVTTWAEVPDPSAITGVATRHQVSGAAHFNGGEGIWHDSGTIYFSTKGDNSLRSYDIATRTIEKLYDPAESGNGGFLDGPDNLTVSRARDVFVCEDNGTTEFDVVMVTPERVIAPFLRCSGSIHARSELAGVIFSPDGERMYVSSQRAYGSGAVYEITGPFRAALDDGGDDEPPTQTDPTDTTPTTPTTPTDTTPTTPTTPTDTTPTTPADTTPTNPGGGGGTPTTPAANPPGGPGAAGDGAHGPGAGAGGTGGNVDAPGLRIAAVRRVTLAQLHEGFTVYVAVDAAARVDVALRTSDLGTEPGQRGSAPRAKSFTLGTRAQTVRPGRRTRVRVQLKPAELRRLRAALELDRRRHRKQQLIAHVVIQARGIDGGRVAIATRDLLIVPAPQKHGARR